MITNKLLQILALATLSSFCLIAPAEASSSATCNRECLKEHMTRYLNAMIAHKPDSLPLADDVRFTEDSKEIKIGEGYWKDIAGSVGYRLDIIDVRMGGVFAFVVIKNGSSSILLGVRLKIINDKISQIETMVVKNSSEGMIFTPAGFKSPDDSIMTKMPKESQLNTREEMMAMAVKYPESFKISGGTFAKGGVPFVKSAYRLENGQLMAGPGCTFFSGCDDIRTQTLPPLSKMLHEVALVDEQAGITLLRMNFGPGSVMNDNKNTLDVFEAFKIHGDSVHAVVAFMQKIPDISNRTTKALFNWDYTNDVTAVKNTFPAPVKSETIKVLPCNGKLSISLQSSGIVHSVTLYDISGRMVHSFDLSENITNAVLPVHLPTFSAGRYLGIVKYRLDNEERTSRFSVVVAE